MHALASVHTLVGGNNVVFNQLDILGINHNYKYYMSLQSVHILTEQISAIFHIKVYQWEDFNTQIISLHWNKNELVRIHIVSNIKIAY